jgi:uncharacterized BrkB/YihY/UPF0761 family membrane protein
LDNKEPLRRLRQTMAEIHRRRWSRRGQVSVRARIVFSVLGFAAVTLITVLLLGK